ncbi:MAG: hypothetical protein MI747_09320, partial [Desulfobacterales bacterium]|nr:hypothetical protein [Desulfobacterales bacterium]
MARDRIIQPSFSLFTGQVVTFVVPEALIDEIGEEAAQSRVDQVVRIINGFTPTYARAVGSITETGQGVVSSFLNRGSLSPSLRPTSVGDALGLGALGALSDPAAALPENTGVVIYLNPDQVRPEAVTSVYRVNQALGTGESSVSVISLSGYNPVGTNLEVTPSLLSGLFLSAQAGSGNLTDDSLVNAGRIAWDVSHAMGIGDGRDRVEIIQADQVDRIGFEYEVFYTRLNSLSGREFGSRTLLGYTAAKELGLPVLKLEIDLGVVGRPGEAGSRFFPLPELILAPLKTNEYYSPELYHAKDILMKQFKALNQGETLGIRELIRNYNREVVALLGKRGERYVLKEANQVDLNDITVQVYPGYSTDDVAYGGQATALVPYGNLYTDAFLESLKIEDRHFNAFRSQSIKLLKRGADLLASSWRAHGIEMTPEMKSFALHLVFSEMARVVVGDMVENKFKHSVIFRFAPEDVVMSVLSDAQAEQLHGWFQDVGNQEVLRNMLEKRLVPSGDDSEAWQRMENVLDRTTALRRETGRVPLGVNAHSNSTLVRIGDGSGRYLNISHATPDSRRSIVEKDGAYYVGVEYRKEIQPITQMANSFENWFDGVESEALDPLIEGMSFPDNYVSTAFEFVKTSRVLLGMEDWSLPGVRPQLTALVTDLADNEEDLFDENDRVPSEDEGWFREVYRTASQLRDRSRAQGWTTETDGLSRELSRVFAVDITNDLVPTDQAVFRNNGFDTWQGHISLEELGLPAQWRPGDAVPGYTQKIETRDHIYVYTGGEDLDLPGTFRMTWNGKYYPEALLRDLPQSSELAATPMTFEDARRGTAVQRRMELPQGALRLDGESGHLFGYRLPGLGNEVLVVVNALDFMTRQGQPYGDPVQAMLAMKQAIAVLQRTQTGRSLLARVGNMPTLGAGDLADTPRPFGLDRQALFSQGDLSMVISLTHDTESLERVRGTSG